MKCKLCHLCGVALTVFYEYSCSPLETYGMFTLTVSVSKITQFHLTCFHSSNKNYLVTLYFNKVSLFPCYSVIIKLCTEQY